MAAQTTLRDHWGSLALTLSCKAIAFENGKLWLRKNERDDWELPGGRLEEGEQPEETVVRELNEELGAEVHAVRLVDVYVWEKNFGKSTHIGIVTFQCNVRGRSGKFELIGEAGNAEFELVSVQEALELKNLPEVYKRALRKL